MCNENDACSGDAVGDLVPLAVAGQMIGVLTADKPTPNSFTNTDLVVLSTLADQAAVAIENAACLKQNVNSALSETLRDLSPRWAAR